MSKKYHITDDGPKPCTANIKECPIGGEHYTTIKETEQKYDEKMKDAVFTTYRKQHQETGKTKTPRTVTRKISPENMEKSKKLIERLNRKLERAGIEERFEVTYTEKTHHWVEEKTA